MSPIRPLHWLAALPALAWAAAAGSQSTPTSDAMQRLRSAETRARDLPDTPGDGACPVLKEEVAGLPDHVVYRPADLSHVRGRALPILVWGNGGCQADGAAQRFHLAEIERVPAAVVNLRDAGHGGTFFEPNGGKAARIAVAWLDWQLKGDAASKRLFVGAGCGLCTDPGVTIERKRLD